MLPILIPSCLSLLCRLCLWPFWYYLLTLCVPDQTPDLNHSPAPDLYSLVCPTRCEAPEHPQETPCLGPSISLLPHGHLCLPRANGSTPVDLLLAASFDTSDLTTASAVCRSLPTPGHFFFSLLFSTLSFACHYRSTSQLPLLSLGLPEPKSRLLASGPITRGCLWSLHLSPAQPSYFGLRSHSEIFLTFLWVDTSFST